MNTYDNFMYDHIKICENINENILINDIHTYISISKQLFIICEYQDIN